MWKVIGKSALKGLKAVGQVAGAGALTAVGTYVASPEALAAIAAATGMYAPLVTLLLTFALRAGQDAVKHRDKASE